MAHDAFISYSSTDSNAALAVLHGLEAGGVRCWMAPRDIKPGAIWAQSIMEGISGARVMVVVFSANANRSAHVINEVDAAVRKGAIIVPLRIEDVMPDGAMEYHLRTRHWLDALTPDLARHTDDLAEQIRLLLETRPAGESIPTPPPRMRPEDLPKPRSRPAVRKPPRRPSRRVLLRGAAIGVPVLIAAAWLMTRERVVSGVEFTAHEVSASGGNVSSLRIVSGAARFFESGRGVPQVAARQYTDSFAKGPTRYINVEVPLHHEEPGRSVPVSIACVVARGDEVVTTLALNHRVAPNDTVSFPAAGWGSPQGNSWRPGRYEVGCRHGDQLVARDWFIVSDGGTVAGSVTGPAAETPALAAIGARVTAVRLFEADANNIPQFDARNYQTTFDGATTRFIYTEVTLSYRAPGEVVRAQLQCRYLRNRSDEVARFNIPLVIQPTWTASYNQYGWGRSRPGWWAAGRYLVACDDGQRTLGQAEFVVR